MLPRRWLPFAPTAAVLAFAILRAVRGSWADYTGYIDAGRSLLAGSYSTADSNTWPPFFSLVAIPLYLLSLLPQPLAKMLWATATISGFALATNRWWREAKPEGTPDWVAPVGAFLVSQFWLHHLVYHQVYGLIFACAALGFIEAHRKRDVRAGIWIGLGGLAKVTPALTLAFFVFTRRWKVVGAAAATAVLGTLLLIPFLGVNGTLGAYLRWLEVIGALGGPHGVLNQSLPALIDRHITDQAVRDGVGVAPLLTLDWTLAEKIARGISYLLFAGLAMLMARRKVGPLLAFAPLVAAAVYVAPYCWRSQLVAFLPLLLLTLAELAKTRERWGLVLLAPFVLLMPEREPDLIGWKAYLVTEGISLTSVCMLLLLVQASRFVGVRRAADERLETSAATPGTA